MTVEAERAIQFECEECGEIQYHEYSLQDSWLDNRAVNADNIMCEKCGHDNFVFEEL